MISINHKRTEGSHSFFWFLGIIILWFGFLLFINRIFLVHHNPIKQFDLRGGVILRTLINNLDENTEWSAGGKNLIWHMLSTYAEKQGLLALNTR